MSKALVSNRLKVSAMRYQAVEVAMLFSGKIRSTLFLSPKNWIQDRIASRLTNFCGLIPTPFATTCAFK